MLGIPVFVHWTFPLGGLFIASFARASWQAALYCVVAFTVLILAHEFGHVIAAVSQRVKVQAVYISGLGGRCQFEPPRSLRSAFLIVTGGLLAQLMIFALSAAYVAAFGSPKSMIGICFVNTFTLANLFLMVFNLIPHRDSKGLATDGRMLWELVLYSMRRRPNPWPTVSATPLIFPRDTALLTKPELIPHGFKVGIEILNDDKTPMGFVVHVLTKNLEIDQRAAINIMLSVHNNGGILWPLKNMDVANRVSSGIAADCQAHNQPLVCRAVQI